jgi:septal ring factor EnvC (AmiA/AmiB activator)
MTQVQRSLFTVLWLGMSLTYGGIVLAAGKDLKSLEKKITDEEKELSLLLKKIDSGQKRLGELKIHQSSTRERILQNKSEHQALAKKVGETENSANQTRQELQEISESLKKARRDFSSYEASFYSRLAHFFRNRNQPFLKILLSSGSLSNLSDRMHFYRRIVEADSGQFNKLRVQSRVIKTKQDEMQRQKSHLDILNKRLIAEKNSLLNKIQSDKDYLLKIHKEQTNLKDRAVQMDEASQYLRDRIQNLISARDQMRNDRDSRHLGELMKHRKKVAPGSLEWPMRGKFLISRKFGHEERSSATIFNPGIDLEPPEPQSIYASEDGIIFYKGTPAGSSSTYGKVVMIAHGKYDGKFTTLYGNLSTILVALNQTVKRGDKIATISASNILGQYHAPRLHYQVRINGEPTNPIKWLKKQEKI